MTEAPTVEQLRRDVFAILRRHDVSEQCFAEVAMVTHAFRTQQPRPDASAAAIEHKIEAYRNSGIDECLAEIPTLKAQAASAREWCGVRVSETPTQIADTPGAGLLPDDEGLRQLGLLYNYAEGSDARQFTRWQMLIAMQHGMSLASDGVRDEISEDGPDEITQLKERLKASEAECDRQEGLAKAYRQAQLTAEQKLYREQDNAKGWQKRAEYLESRRPDASVDGLALRLRACANGLRGSMWANRNDTIKLLDEAADALSSTTREAVVEECAKVADKYHKGLVGIGLVGRGEVNEARVIAAAIRALTAKDVE